MQPVVTEMTSLSILLAQSEDPMLGSHGWEVAYHNTSKLGTDWLRARYGRRDSLKSGLLGGWPFSFPMLGMRTMEAAASRLTQ